VRFNSGGKLYTYFPHIADLISCQFRGL
jgi:hypothetical protein